MDICIAVIVGVLIGRIVSKLTLRRARVGILRFFDSEPGEPPVMTAELNKPVEEFQSRKYVVFDISHK